MNDVSNIAEQWVHKVHAVRVGGLGDADIYECWRKHEEGFITIQYSFEGEWYPGLSEAQHAFLETL